MDSYMLALDQGTTSTRCLVFDPTGRVVAMDQMEHRQICPAPGLVEHDPWEIWENTQKVLLGAISKAHLDHHDIKGLGITNQRETVLAWDRRTGQPLHNALVWQDTRTHHFCHELEAAHGETLRRKTGLPPATYFSATKLRWLLDNVPGLRGKAERGDALAGTIDTWLLWNLTGGPHKGVHCTDVSNAARTQLMDITTLEWDDGLLELFGIPRAMLPEIRPSAHYYGVSDVLGIHIPVGALLGDQQAALYGQGCLRPGEAKNTYGTGCFLLMNTGTVPQFSANGLLTTVAYQLEGQPPVYCLEGSVAMAGALIHWLRDQMGLAPSSHAIAELADGVPDNGGVYIVPAFSGLFAPWWRSDARGTVMGLTRFAHRGHIARAAIEATAFQVADVVSAMERDSGTPLGLLRVDGGMAVNDTLLQFQADLLGIPVQRPAQLETSAWGAAKAAGAALSWELREVPGEGPGAVRSWTPAMAPEARAALVKTWHKALEKSMGWVDED